MKKTEYLSNKEFTQKIIEFQQSGKSLEELPNEIIEMLKLLIKKISNRRNFSSYTWLEDMRDEAMYYCLKAIQKFDGKKSNNAFTYFTTVSFNAFRQFLNSEKHYKLVKELYQENLELDEKVSSELHNRRQRQS